MLRRVPTLYGDAVTTHNYTIVFPIDGVDYLFEFQYNAREDRWGLSITDPSGDPVVTGATIVLNVNLFTYASAALRPPGFLTCAWLGTPETAQEPGELDLGKTSQIYYFERVEDIQPVAPEEPALA